MTCQQKTASPRARSINSAQFSLVWTQQSQTRSNFGNLNSVSNRLKRLLEEMSPQSWFITGATRGVGLAVVKQLLTTQSDSIVFAGARNPTTATSLKDLVASYPSRLHIVKLDSTSAEDAKKAAAYVEKTTDGLDYVFANAGYVEPSQQKFLEEVSTAAIKEHFEVNTVGPIILFQALYPLLLKRQTRKFIAVSTVLSSMAIKLPSLAVPDSPYTLSKAALNFLVVKIAAEYKQKGVIALAVHPGLIETGNYWKEFAKQTGFPTITTAQSAEGLVKLIMEATAEQSGRFWNFDGKEFQY